MTSRVNVNQARTDMTNPTNLTELTGIEGFRAALGESERWEFDAPGDAGWCKLSDELEQNIGSKYLTQPGRRWRRIPDTQQAPTQAELSAALRNKLEVQEWSTAGNHLATYQVREVLMSQAPGGADWQPCLSDTEHACATWFVAGVGGFDRDWRIIEPAAAPPAESELPAEMDAERATEWLRSGNGRTCRAKSGTLWFPNDVVNRKLPGPDVAPYTPLVPLTRGQLAEIESKDKQIGELESLLDAWSPLTNWARQLTSAPLRTEPCVRYALAEINGLANRIRSAIGSRDAALAALEQERKKKKALRLALEDLLDMVHSDAAQNAERVLNETAGKESIG
jgi:hypothetical protein